MNISPPRQSHPRHIRRPVTDADFQVYRAITGSSLKTNGMKPRSPQRAEVPPTHGGIAKRAFVYDLTQFSLRLREIFEMGLANGVKRAQMADWLRQMSDEAFKRLDQAQVRLTQPRSALHRRRVQARDVSVQDETPENLQNVA